MHLKFTEQQLTVQFDIKVTSCLEIKKNVQSSGVISFIHYTLITN